MSRLLLNGLVESSQQILGFASMPHISNGVGVWWPGCSGGGGPVVLVVICLMWWRRRVVGVDLKLYRKLRLDLGFFLGWV